MLLQTNSYIVPKEKRAEHSRIIRRFRQTLRRLGCDHFEVYEQVGSNWSNSESAGRYVQILRFVDRKHQLSVQSAERVDPSAQAVIADFCELINFPYQQQQGLFAVGFYTSVLPVMPKRGTRGELISTVEHEVVDDPEAEAVDGEDLGDIAEADVPNEAPSSEPNGQMSETTSESINGAPRPELSEHMHSDKSKTKLNTEEFIDFPAVEETQDRANGFIDAEVEDPSAGEHAAGDAGHTSADAKKVDERSPW